MNYNKILHKLAERKPDNWAAESAKELIKIETILKLKVDIRRRQELAKREYDGKIFDLEQELSKLQKNCSHLDVSRESGQYCSSVETCNICGKEL